MEIIEILSNIKQLEDNIVCQQEGVQFYSDAMIAIWQKRIEDLKAQLAEYSIEPTTGEITKKGGI